MGHSGIGGRGNSSKGHFPAALAAFQPHVASSLSTPRPTMKMKIGRGSMHTAHCRFKLRVYGRSGPPLRWDTFLDAPIGLHHHHYRITANPSPPLRALEI